MRAFVCVCTYGYSAHSARLSNFLMTDSTWENGPIRTILGSHCNVQQPPRTDEEPEWMRLSTLVGAPAGSAIFRTCLNAT